MVRSGSKIRGMHVLNDACSMQGRAWTLHAACHACACMHEHAGAVWGRFVGFFSLFFIFWYFFWFILFLESTPLRLSVTTTHAGHEHHRGVTSAPKLEQQYLEGVKKDLTLREAQGICPKLQARCNSRWVPRSGHLWTTGPTG